MPVRDSVESARELSRKEDHLDVIVCSPALVVSDNVYEGRHLGNGLSFCPSCTPCSTYLLLLTCKYSFLEHLYLVLLRQAPACVCFSTECHIDKRG